MSAAGAFEGYRLVGVVHDGPVRQGIRPALRARQSHVEDVRGVLARRRSAVQGPPGSRRVRAAERAVGRGPRRQPIASSRGGSRRAGTPEGLHAAHARRHPGRGQGRANPLRTCRSQQPAHAESRIREGLPAWGWHGLPRVLRGWHRWPWADHPDPDQALQLQRQEPDEAAAGGPGSPGDRGLRHRVWRGGPRGDGPRGDELRAGALRGHAAALQLGLLGLQRDPAAQHRREGRIRQNACSALPQGRRRHLALLQLRRLVGPLSDHI
mmetsp:Transcript_67421/g.175528  ORF Transcript_67421/g.175528 Transcript_67421/m.175528 type:complete len:267 (-) Transcript_67421:684-1484(-)